METSHSSLGWDDDFSLWQPFKHQALHLCDMSYLDHFSVHIIATKGFKFELCYWAEWLHSARTGWSLWSSWVLVDIAAVPESPGPFAALCSWTRGVSPWASFQWGREASPASRYNCEEEQDNFRKISNRSWMLHEWTSLPFKLRSLPQTPDSSANMD